MNEERRVEGWERGGETKRIEIYAIAESSTSFPCGQSCLIVFPHFPKISMEQRRIELRRHVLTLLAKFATLTRRQSLTLYVKKVQASLKVRLMILPFFSGRQLVVGVVVKEMVTGCGTHGVGKGSGSSDDLGTKCGALTCGKAEERVTRRREMQRKRVEKAMLGYRSENRSEMACVDFGRWFGEVFVVRVRRAGEMGMKWGLYREGK